MNAAISVKGLRNGVLITLDRGEFAAQLTELAELIESRKSFFQGGQVALQVGDRALERDELVGLCRILSQRGVALSALLGTNATTCSHAEALGLRTRLAPALDAPPPDVAPAAAPVEAIGGAAVGLVSLPTPELSEHRQGVLVERTLRSGQSVHCAGHVVVLGDVNSGAEVIAGGDVIVWGHLRGIVHAGALGDPARCVCALDLSPTQLRIGSHIARPPENQRRPKETRPERAFVNNDQIVAERWR